MAPANRCGQNRARERGIRSWRAPSPRREASARRKSRRDAKERRRDLELQAPTMAAARARFLRKRRLRLRFGISRGSRVPFIGAEHGPGRAGPRGTRRRARGRVGLEPESGSVGEEDAPDRWGPPGSESGRGKGRWAGTGRKARRTGRRGGKRDGAPVGPKQKKTAREKEKRRKRKRWAGLKGVRGKKRVFQFQKRFSNNFNSNSNSKI